VFAHGILTMGLTGKMLTNWVGDGTLTKFGVRSTNQIWPSDTLQAKATIAVIRDENGQNLADLTISTTNRIASRSLRIRDYPPRPLKDKYDATAHAS
jgi:acyl dehydratase